MADVQNARRVVAAAGIPTLEPIPTSGGSPFVELSNGILAELEDYVAWDAGMKTHDLLTEGFAALAQIHTALRKSPRAAGLTEPAAANYVSSSDVIVGTEPGLDRIVGWREPSLMRLGAELPEHCHAVAAAEQEYAAQQVVQPVHGDFWDDNVLFRSRALVAVLDFDFMSVRSRVDDLALTLWFLLLEPGNGIPTPRAAARLLPALRAYDAAAEHPLSPQERASLPLAIARQPAWSVAVWVRRLSDKPARLHARGLIEELPVAQAIMHDLPRWQAELAG